MYHTEKLRGAARRITARLSAHREIPRQRSGPPDLLRTGPSGPEVLRVFMDGRRGGVHRR
ncbi:hypothetical protein ABT324_01970 [Saccharopolyspora sp. NPDC000359]|uniref:hypothetical protein n=1 Tax=Saccharopolyspora sp. NPDC000359 TaxID=3154251 RepID=UPI00332ADC51